MKPSSNVIPDRMDIIKNKHKRYEVLGRRWTKEKAFTQQVEMYVSAATVETVWGFQQHQKTTALWPAIPLPYNQGSWNLQPIKINVIPMFATAVFTNQVWKQAKIAVDRWMGTETRIYAHMHVCRVSQSRVLMNNMKTFCITWGIFSKLVAFICSCHTGLLALITGMNGSPCEKINMLTCFAMVTIFLTIFVPYKIMGILEIHIIKFIKRLQKQM